MIQKSAQPVLPKHDCRRLRMEWSVVSKVSKVEEEENVKEDVVSLEAES